MTPSLSLGVRHDGGDADPLRGLDLVWRMHGLAAHAEDGYANWGVSGSLRLAPADPQARFDAELGYGLALSGGLTGTPYVGFGLSETAREARMGWRLNRADGGAFGVHLDAARSDSGIEGAPETEHRIGARFTTHW